MLTANRFGLARRAVSCFRNQTYPNRELMVLDTGDDTSLVEWIDDLRDSSITCIQMPRNGISLGELRNISVECSTGEYLAGWDDDDLSDPLRLELQLSAVKVFATDACFLERQMIWWSERRRLAYSVRRIWEPSSLCRRDSLGRYPHLDRGEDTPVADRIVARSRIALVDMPRLYIHVFHGKNTFGSEHWEEHWNAATEHFEGSRYDSALREIQRRLNLDLSHPSGPEGL